MGNIEKRPVLIDGFSGYYVDSKGNVYGKRGRLLRPSINQGGYKMVVLCNSCDNLKTVPVHRLVALSFVPGYQEGLIVNHKDGNKLNNNAGNLEWVTPSENVRHAIEVLGVRFGEKNKRKVLAQKSNQKYEFESIADAARWLSNNSETKDQIRNRQRSIWRALNGWRNSYYGFKWNYAS